jgi:hypothetical protein
VIQPTVTQRVRAFLSSQGAQVQAWSGLDETYAALYTLLNRRRDDPAFWPPVRALLQEIVDTAQRGRDAAGVETAELLASWDLAALVADLRAALPGVDAPVDTGVVQRFASRLSTAVMGGFLLLGLAAAGCGDDSKSKPPADLKSDAWNAGCTLPASSVLYTTIDTSSASNAQKAKLCTCFASLSTSWGNGLTTLFQTGTAAEIATVVEQMAACCGNATVLGGDFASAKDRLLRGSLCAIPVYKGVSFPR